MRQRDFLAACLVACAVGCGRGDEIESGALPVGEYAHDSVVFGESRAAEPSDSLALLAARAPDQRFLERLLDHFEGLDYLATRIAHGDAARRAKHQAWRFSTREDPDKRHVAELLRSRFGERYMPIVPLHFKRASDSLAALPGDEQQRALVRLLAEHRRADVAEIDTALPALRDRAVRRLAEDLRENQSRELALLLRRLGDDDS
jgi:hypothetical protein